MHEAIGVQSMEVEHHPCDTPFLAEHRGHLAYRRAYARAQYLGFASVYGFLSWKLKKCGDRPSDLAGKLDVSTTTVKKWLAIGGIK